MCSMYSIYYIYTCTTYILLLHSTYMNYQQVSQSREVEVHRHTSQPQYYSYTTYHDILLQYSVYQDQDQGFYVSAWSQLL